MAKWSQAKTRQGGRFFGLPLHRSKAPQKGRTAGQSSTVGYRLPRCVSISQTKGTLLEPWPFQIHLRRRYPANAVNDHALPLRLNRSRLAEDRIEERKISARESSTWTAHGAVAT